MWLVPAKVRTLVEKKGRRRISFSQSERLLAPEGFQHGSPSPTTQISHIATSPLPHILKLIMGFFGSVVDDNEFEMDIPDAYSLNFIQACLDPSNESSVTLFVKPANEDHFFILCTLNKGSCPNCPLSHTFGPEDSPIR